MALFKIVLVLMMVVARSFTLPAGTLPGDRSAGTKFDVSSSFKEEEEPILPPRDYAFNYDIADGFAGMTHARSEVRKNGITRGFYSYTRPDGVLVSVSYTADESGFHPIITEEAAPSMVSNRAIQSMFSSDHPEEIKVTLTQEDVDLARRKLDEARMRSKQQLKHSMELLSPAASESQSVLLTAFPDAFTRSIETVSYSPTTSGETMARTAKLIQNDSSIVRKRVFTNSH